MENNGLLPITHFALHLALHFVIRLYLAMQLTCADPKLTDHTDSFESLPLPTPQHFPHGLLSNIQRCFDNEQSATRMQHHRGESERIRVASNHSSTPTQSGHLLAQQCLVRRKKRATGHSRTQTPRSNTVESCRGKLSSRCLDS